GPGHRQVRGGVHGAGDLVPAAPPRLVVPDGRAPGDRARRRRGRGVEDPDLGRVKRTAAALGSWIVFEDECGQSMRPPRSRTWGRRGITPVIRVRGGGTGRGWVAGLACCRPGYRSRLICRLHFYRGRKDETKAFSWIEYRDLLIAAHRQLPGGNIVLICRVGGWRGGVLSGVRSRSHFSPGFPCGPLHCGDHDQALRFQPPPHRTVRAVLPHTAHRRRSPPAFGFSRPGFPALGATTIPYKLIRPRSAGDDTSITCHPKPRLRRCFLLRNSASRVRAYCRISLRR